MELIGRIMKRAIPLTKEQETGFAATHHKEHLKTFNPYSII